MGIISQSSSDTDCFGDYNQNPVLTSAAVQVYNGFKLVQAFPKVFPRFRLSMIYSGAPLCISASIRHFLFSEESVLFRALFSDKIDSLVGKV